MTYVPQLQTSRNTEAMAWLHDDVLAVLHSPSAVSPAFTDSAGSNVGGNNPLRFSAWPGSDFGVRAPYPSETALSWDEVEHGRINGYFANGNQ
jgi:hypothetical protein